MTINEHRQAINPCKQCLNTLANPFNDLATSINTRADLFNDLANPFNDLAIVINRRADVINDLAIPLNPFATRPDYIDPPLNRRAISVFCPRLWLGGQTQPINGLRHTSFTYASLF